MGRIKNAINEYWKMIRKDGRRYALYCTDYDEVIAISGTDRANVIFNAMQAGFVIGYRAGKRDAKRLSNDKS